MRTNSTSKPFVLGILLLVIATVMQAKPSTHFTSSINSLDPISELKVFSNMEEIDSTCVIDTFFLDERYSDALKLHLRPAGDTVQWRYRSLGDIALDSLIADSLWTLSTSFDTCCTTIESLEPTTSYVIEVRRWCPSEFAFGDWYSIVDSTRCVGPSLDEVSIFSTSDRAISMMCDIESPLYEWVVGRVGSDLQKHIVSSSNTIEWKNLQNDAKYILRVRIRCGYDWSDYSPADTVTTGNYVEADCGIVASDEFYTSNLMADQAQLNCSKSALQYNWGFRESSSDVWLTQTTDVGVYVWKNLTPGKNYEYRVRVKCADGSWTNWSNLHYFSASGSSYGSDCKAPEGSHMSHKSITYNSGSTHCSMSGYGYLWSLRPYGGSWKEHTTSKNYYNWSDLQYGSKYEYKVKVKCHDGSWSDWSTVHWFETPDHHEVCEAPGSGHLSIKDLTYNSASAHCSMQGYGYTWYMRPYGTYSWKSYSSSNSYYKWDGLKYGTKYEYMLKVKCKDGSWSGWSSKHYFTTPDHYGNSCGVPQSHHLSIKNLTYSTASSHCSMDGYGYTWYMRPHGSYSWKTYNSSHNYMDWSGLNYGTKYEYMVKVKCHDGSWSGWSSKHYFTTPDHYGNSCGVPQSHHLSIKNLTYNSASSHCSMSGYGYTWYMRPYGSGSWKTYNSSHNYMDWTSLNYGTKYEYMVKVKCHDGSWSGWSSKYYFTTPDHYGNTCEVPSSHHMSIKNLTYNTASSHCSMSGYGYTWYMRPYGSYSWKTYNSSHNYYDWTGLDYGTKYEYMVKVKCHDGSWSGWSSKYYFTTPDHYGNSCGTPQSHHMSHKNVTYNAGSTYCSMDGSEYHWYLRPYGSSTWTDYSSHNNYYNWTGLQYGTKYEYKVKVKCHNGSWTGWSSIYWFKTPDHYQDNCGTPQNNHLSIQNLSHNYATGHCSMAGTGYKWYMRPYGSSVWKSYETSGSSVNWSGLSPDTKYEYMMKVLCGGGWSGWSSKYYFTTPYHSGNNNCYAPTYAHLSHKNVTYNGASTHCTMQASKYHWYMRPYGHGDWSHYQTSSSYYNWNNLNYGTKYEYKVKIQCSSGVWTDYSGTQTFTTPDHYGSNTCGAPESQHMSHTGVTYNSGSTHCSMTGSEYHWYMRPQGQSNWSDHTSYSNSYNWTGLSYGTKYEYRVKVKCHNGAWTGYSGIYSFSTPDHHYAGCTAPYSSEFNAVLVQWDVFHIYIYVPQVKFTTAVRLSGGAEWYEHTTYNTNKIGWGNLAANSKYEYMVKRQCSDGTWSPWSSIKSFWTGGGSGAYAKVTDVGEPMAIEQNPLTEKSFDLRSGSSSEQEATDFGSISDEALTPTTAADGLQVFPNPAKNYVNIIGAIEGSNLMIIDMQGRVVLNQVKTSGSDKIDVHGLENGMYHLQVVNKIGILESRRIVIMR